MSEEEISFESLIGLHRLAAVDLSTESIKDDWGLGYDDCNVLRFTLDGKTYVAAEDPDDGYRSSMRYLKRSKTKPKNVFPFCKVFVKIRNKSRSQADNVLEFWDVITGKLVLEVGTENVDDYYPCFVASFHPEAMAVNAALGVGK